MKRVTSNERAMADLDLATAATAALVFFGASLFRPGVLTSSIRGLTHE